MTLVTETPVPSSGPAPVPAQGRPRRRGAPPWLVWVGYAALAAQLVAFSLLSPVFPTASNTVTVLTQGAVLAIAGFGMAVVLITGGDDVLRGGIDLSTGAVVGLSGVVAAVLTAAGASAVVALPVALLVALVVGAVNAAAVVLGVRPLLATLASGAVASSVTLVLTQNVKVPVSGGVFGWLRDGSVVGLPASVVVLALVFAVTATAVGATRWGVRAYAAGQNPVAAAVAGVPVQRYVATSYLVSALLAGLAGLLLTARLSAGVPGVGDQLLLDVILTASMSVVFSRRLVVTIPGTLVSALFVAALTNGFTLAGVGSQWVGAVKGVLILLVVAVAAVRERSVQR